MHLQCGRRPQRGWTERARARRKSTHRLETLLTQCSARYPPIGCRPSVACRWGRTSDAPPKRTSAARTGKLACASPAAPASGCAPSLAWPQLLLLPGSVACASSAAAAAALCAPAQMAVRRRAARVACASTSSSMASWLSDRTPCAGTRIAPASSEHDDRSDRLDLRARDADGGSYRRRVAERLPRSTSLALGSRLSEEELHLVPAGHSGAARLN